MKRTVSLFEFMPYGAPELLAADRPHLARALMLSSFAAVLVFLAAWPMLSGVGMPLQRDRHLSCGGVTIRLESHELISPRPLLPPPPLDGPPRRVAPSQASPANTIPIPLPMGREIGLPNEVDRAFLGETQPAWGRSDVILSGVSAPAGATETLPERGRAVPVDELPAETFVFKPEYPSFARDAGVEGLVVVHALIGLDGRIVRVAMDDKHTIPLLDETAREAALKWRFSPAIYQGRPVAVWYAIPFRFVLNGP